MKEEGKQVYAVDSDTLLDSIIRYDNNLIAIEPSA